MEEPPNCMYLFLDIFFYLKIRRKPLFYIVNLIIPCVGIFYLSILVFYLPAQSGEKTALAIAILVSQTLYFTLVIEVSPWNNTRDVPLNCNVVVGNLMQGCIVFALLLLKWFLSMTVRHAQKPV